jgi:UDP-N-acetylglucosamine transferase subunit ALG13
MILLTCGTNEQPFDRLVAAAHLFAGERLVVQYGASNVEHGDGEWRDFVSFEQLSALMTEARVVICHAGVGSIILASRCGKVPLVVPRRLHLAEAVDDHQLSLARRLHELGLVELVQDTSDLPERARLANGTARIGTVDELPGAEALVADLRATLDATMMRRQRSKLSLRMPRRAPGRALFGFRDAAVTAVDGAQVKDAPYVSAATAVTPPDDQSHSGSLIG